MNENSRDARRMAVRLSADTMAEIISFWGFKASMGRIWTVLYLSIEPVSADVIAEETELSAGMVSMSLQELMQWGLVSRDPLSTDRKRRYVAETDIWAIIRRIIRERELRLVGRAVERFKKAVELLEEAQQKHPDDRDVAFMLERLRGLQELAQLGYRLVEKLADLGQLSLSPLKGALSRLS